MDQGIHYKHRAILKPSLKPKPKEPPYNIPIERIKQNKLITLTRYLNDYDRVTCDPSYQFSQLITAVETIVKVISGTLKRSGLGLSSILHNDPIEMTLQNMALRFEELTIKSLIESRSASVIVVKNVVNIIKVERGIEGKYMIAMSVLDDELTEDATSCMGTTFSVFERKQTKNVVADEILQPGKNAVAAGYVVYGRATIFTLAIKDKVKVFFLDPLLGEFLLTHEDLKIPDIGYVYSVNEGHSYFWSTQFEDYLNQIKDPKNEEPWLTRYSGSFAADCHRVLILGGIFCCPKSYTHRQGKLGLLYEAVPLAYVATKVGATAWSAKEQILNIVPKCAHEKTEFYAGSKPHIMKLVKDFFGINYELEEEKISDDSISSISS